MSVEGAHTKGTETGSAVFSVDGRTILTRGGDDTVKRRFFSFFSFTPPRLILIRTKTVWDLRSFKKPLVTRSNIVTLYPTTNATFSPDEKHIVTGCGSAVKGGKGKLLFLRRDDLEIAQEIEMDSTPVKVVWHPKINQVCLMVHFFDPIAMITSYSTRRLSDFDRACERADNVLVLARDVVERGETATEQRSGKETDD
jgi:WD40 repeat protein